VRKLNVTTDTKTKDNVTVRVECAIMFKVNDQMCSEAFYKVQNVQQQISAFVDDEVRSELPTMTMDEAYESKSQMADAVMATLQASMQEYGLIIVKCLVVDLQPDRKVIEPHSPPCLLMRRESFFLCSVPPLPEFAIFTRVCVLRPTGGCCDERHRDLQATPRGAARGSRGAEDPVCQSRGG